MKPPNKVTRGRKPIDPDGATQALTIRLSSALKAELETAAGRNSRSLSQEIAARLAGPPTEQIASPLLELVSAFEERLALFSGSDWRDAEAAAALSKGLRSLLEKVVAKSTGPKEAAGAKTGELVAELTFGWLQGRSDPAGVALRDAFRGTSS